ncbi:hypothetical protein N7448_004646 [Penicillium atrosanguineum]|nr:hypothetical protein N7448_004646 [Penicillium atrosanguineum]
MARESVQSRISDYKERVRNLDFVSRSEDRVYYDLVDLPAALTHEIFERHHGIFDERKTFVRHWSDLISGTWASSLETKIRKAVSERYPVVAEPQSSADSRHELPSLVVMVRGAKKEHFQTLGDDGTYQFVSHGHILQVSAKERDIILSLPQSLFEPDDQDLAREKQSIESVLTDTRMRTEEVQKEIAVVDRGHQLITKLEERHSDICKYEDDLSASPGLNVPSESAVPPEAAVPPEPDVPSNQPQIREDSLANSCLFDPRGDIEHESPEKAGTIVADALTPPNPHEEPTLGPAANISTTGTSSVIPLREVEGNTERGNRKSVGTRNAKKLKTGSTYRDVPSADSDPFNNFSDSTEAGEDSPPMSLTGTKKASRLVRSEPNGPEERLEPLMLAQASIVSTGPHLLDWNVEVLADGQSDTLH